MIIKVTDENLKLLLDWYEKNTDTNISIFVFYDKIHFIIPKWFMKPQLRITLSFIK